MTINAIKKGAVVGAAALALLLTACGEGGTTEGGATTTGEDASATAMATETAASEGAVTLEDGVVRAKDTDVAMTAIFGALSNASDEDVQIVGIDTDLEEGRYEIHEVVDGVMQEKEDGLNLRAGEEHTLEPGSPRMA